MPPESDDCRTMPRGDAAAPAAHRQRRRGMLAGAARGALVLALASPLGALADGPRYPDRALKIIVPLGPGSGGDGYARFFAERMSAILGQPVVVENLPGAGGTLAALALKRAPADGHTILLGSAGLISTNPIMVRELPYKPLEDFTPVAGIARGMDVLLVPAGSGIETIKGLVSAARAATTPLTCGTSSPVYQLAGAWFAHLSGIRFTDVPYKAAGPLAADVGGGQVDLAVMDVASAMPMIRSGRVRAIAVTGERRHPGLADVPTVREGGYPDYVNYAWASLYVLAGTPAPFVGVLADAVRRVQQSPDAEALASKYGGELMPLGSAEMGAFQREEMERLRAVAHWAGIQPK